MLKGFRYEGIPMVICFDCIKLFIVFSSFNKTFWNAWEKVLDARKYFTTINKTFFHNCTKEHIHSIFKKIQSIDLLHREI